MLETTSNLSIKNDSNEYHLEEMAPQHQFSLPLINKHKARNYDDVRSEIETYADKDKNQFALPALSKASAESFRELSKRDHLMRKSKKQFAREVKEKLDLVLGEMPAVNHTLNQQDYDSEDMDFEARINENKQIIKKHKLRKQNGVMESLEIKKKQQASKGKKQIKVPRNESLYQKRARQYRDQSSQNKYLQKKKITIKQKSSNNHNGVYIGESMKDLKPREQYYASVKNEKNQEKKIKAKKPPRVMSHKPSKKQIVEINKSANLFDGIQNFLENPHDGQRKQPKQLVGLTLLKAKRDIQDKIKALNEKMGQIEIQQNIAKVPIKIATMEGSAKDWRRVQIKRDKIQSLNSNFDRELERISSLQERNSQCLQKYLQHQKILVQLELRRLQLSRKDHANSH